MRPPLRRRWRETNAAFGRHEAMHPPHESTRRVWPLRLMALVLFALGIVPMANVVAPGNGLQWWNQSVRLWALWTLAVVALALLIARVAPRVPDALPGLFEWGVLRPSRRAFMVLLALAVALIGVFFSWRLFGLEPLTIDDYFNARMISDPLCLFDYTMESDGAVAAVVTSPLWRYVADRTIARSSRLMLHWKSFCSRSAR